MGFRLKTFPGPFEGQEGITMSDTEVFTVLQVCSMCSGTGLYSGMAERDGAAVLCRVCSGTGCEKFTHTYQRFKGRIPVTDVKRVFEVNPGILVGVDQASGLTLEDFGGMPYEDWAAGKKFPPKSEMRNHTCPAWWYQEADYKREPEWDECTSFGWHSGCRHFKEKDKCWRRFDREGK